MAELVVEQVVVGLVAEQVVVVELVAAELAVELVVVGLVGLVAELVVVVELAVELVEVAGPVEVPTDTYSVGWAAENTSLDFVEQSVHTIG